MTEGSLFDRPVADWTLDELRVGAAVAAEARDLAALLGDVRCAHALQGVAVLLAVARDDRVATYRGVDAIAHTGCGGARARGVDWLRWSSSPHWGRRRTAGRNPPGCVTRKQLSGPPTASRHRPPGPGQPGGTAKALGGFAEYTFTVPGFPFWEFAHVLAV